MSWAKMDQRLVQQVHRRGAKAQFNEFRTATFIPNIARDREMSIDKILMDFKKKDFRYLVHNGIEDLVVCVKRIRDVHALANCAIISEFDYFVVKLVNLVSTCFV